MSLGLVECDMVADGEEGNESETELAPYLGTRKGKEKLKDDLDLLSDESAVSSREDSDTGDSSEGKESSDDSGSSCDLYLPSSGPLGAWREEEEKGGVPLSDATSHRIAVCNMDWDHVGAMDVFSKCTAVPFRDSEAMGKLKSLGKRHL